MADRDGQRVGGVCRWFLVKPQDRFDHHADLGLGGPAAEHGLLDISRRVLVNAQVCIQAIADTMPTACPNTIAARGYFPTNGVSVATMSGL